MKTKMKTKKIAAKRFKVTATGKILRGNQNSRHLRSRKSKSQLRGFKSRSLVHKNAINTINTFLPYS